MRAIDVAIIFLIVLCICLVVIDIVKIKQEGGKCLTNPITFMMKQLSELYDKDVWCGCNGGISINKTGIYKGIGG